jgi:glycosyltransferase involved in cell wall biosynthesis
MVTTQSLKETLENKGFRKLKLWSHGVDTELFRPSSKLIETYEGMPRPILLYFGRVVAEKNLDDFFTLETTGSKVVIGEGGDLKTFIDKYPDVHFLGPKTGEDLATHCAAADLFVFPSLTDTLGLALLEAAAMGLRVAAYPVQGPINIFNSEESDAFAVLDEDLQVAVDKALELPDHPEVPRSFVSSRYTWEDCTRQFLSNLRTSTDT